MFTENSQLVQDYVLLINLGERTLEKVPNISNLREMVAKALAKQNGGQ